MTKSFTDRLREYAAQQRLFGKNDTLIVAISGGMDSVVLAHSLLSIHQPIVLAHCNFLLRGEESDRDEAFVRRFASDRQVPLYVEKTNAGEYAIINKVSIQVAARDIRYRFFDKIRKQIIKEGKTVWIATAHHADDSVETMLMNLFRGTGIGGMKGIPAKNGSIVRPLLFAQRKEIVDYTTEHGLAWVEDSSNQKEDYTRNYIRRTIVPAIEKQFPAAVSSMMDAMAIFKEVSVLYREAVGKRLRKLVVSEGGLRKVPIRKLVKSEYSVTLLYEWLKPYGFTEGNVNEVVKLFNASNGSYVATTDYRVIRNREWLILAPVASPAASLQIVNSLPYVGQLSAGKKVTIQEPHTFSHQKGIPLLPSNEALLDASAIEWPMIIRPWKQGDYFYPLGMAKKKKVARFLIDHKISPVDKENVWVIESNKRIVWVAGWRIDDRFKITPQTKAADTAV